MLSSTKFTALLLLLLVAALSPRSAAFQLREPYETTTATVDEESTLTPTPTPTPTTTKTTKKAVQSSASTQQQIADYAKSVKIFFPSTDEEESKFDIYGLKTTPPPNENKIETGDKLHTTTKATVIETTTASAIAFKAGNSTSNATLTSIDDRLGILNLAPHCPEGHVIVNQRCHKSA